MEITSNEAFFRPTTAETRTFDNANLKEYKKRYAHLNWRTFTHQMKFLADLMNTARERGTQVILISMPITDLNRDLLEKGTWDSYKKSLRVLAQSKDATFVDLGDSKQFAISDFMDTVHLHSGGGMKLLDISRKSSQRQACNVGARRNEQFYCRIEGRSAMTAAPQETKERRAYVSPDVAAKAAMDPNVPKRRATDKLPIFEHRRSGMRAAATWAMLIFCLGNFALSFYNPIDFDPYKYLYRGWTWWGFNEMKKTNLVHNVALLGSSLMVRCGCRR